MRLLLLLLLALLLLKTQFQRQLQLLLFFQTVGLGKLVLLRGDGRLEVGVALLQAVVGILHDTQVWIGLEHVGPFLHALQNLDLDLVVGVAVVGQLEQGVGEGTTGQLAVQVLAAV